MIFHYPYMPYFNRYSRYGYQYPNYNTYKNTNYKAQSIPYEKMQSANNNNINNVCDKKESKKKNCDEETDSPLFEIFGISLYFDDILLICLIFFLYQEGVKDESLFIALILLLLS